MPRAGAVFVGRKGTSRSLIGLVVLFAFALQSFLVQTHLHNLPQSFQAAHMLTVSAPDPAKAPVDIDKCFLCQEYVHGGTFVTPAVAAVMPPSAAVSLLPFVLSPLLSTHRHSHNWMGRAPPRG